MSREVTRSAHRIAAALIVSGGLFGHSTHAAETPAEPSREELQQQIEALKQRVQSLEGADRPTTAPAPASAPTPSAAIDEVLGDADRRSRPVFAAAGGALTAGYDKGFFIKSDDGNFLLKPAINVQFRHVSNFEEDGRQDGNDDSFQSGFEVRRARFRFDGNAFSPKFTYSFVWDTARAGGTVSLLDAWGQYAFADKWAIKVGQFKESVFHERDVSGFAQLAVDRSLNDALLGGTLTDRVQGVSLIHGGGKDDAARFEFAFHDGANSRNTDFRDGATNWGSGLRGEFKFGGDWANYKDFTAKNSKENLLVLGAGAEYTDRDGADVLLATADAQYEVADRFSVYGALHGAYADPHSGTGDPTRFDWGALAQVGYLLNSKWEVFGRYDVVLLDDEALEDGDEDTFHEVTAGVNYYLGPDGSHLHRAKLTADVTYLPNGAPSDQTQSGVLAGEGDQFIVRAQFQLQL